jgi:hypothetical protein
MNAYKVAGGHHYDLFQAWASTGNVLRGNVMRAFTDRNQPYLWNTTHAVSDAQGCVRWRCGRRPPPPPPPVSPPHPCPVPHPDLGFADGSSPLLPSRAIDAGCSGAAGPHPVCLSRLPSPTSRRQGECDRTPFLTARVMSCTPAPPPVEWRRRRIGLFDGWFEGWLIENNRVYVSGDT